MSKRLLGDLAAGQAESLIEQWGITSLPVDPHKIAKEHGILVMPKVSDAPGVSGFLMKRGDEFGIMYATHIKNEGFIRFTISHELGHYFLPGHPEKLFPENSGLHSSKSGFISNDECEIEADAFASALLMPERLFVPVMRKAKSGFPAIEHLASTCLTSITATAIRYARFAEDPIAVIMSSGANIDFCFMSSSIKELRGIEWIRKGTALPRRCQTFDFNRDENNIRQGNRAEAWTSLDLWFDGAPEVEMKEDVVGLGSYGKMLTVLFTEEPLRDEDDATEDDEE